MAILKITVSTAEHPLRVLGGQHAKTFKSWGACCACQIEDGTGRYILMLEKLSPEPGIGCRELLPVRVARGRRGRCPFCERCFGVNEPIVACLAS